MREAESAVARAWCRVDLAGGTLDIWPLGLLHTGARTVNVAVSVAAVVEVHRRSSGYRLEQGSEVVECSSAEELASHPDATLFGLVASELELPPVLIRVACQSPRGAGLGASSALAVAAIAAGEAIRGLPASSAAARAALARDLEVQLMALPTGRQDQWAALLGGVLEIRHAAGGERIERLDVDLDTLGASLVVAYSGQTHFSAGNNWQVVRRRLDGEPEVVAAFEGIAAVAEAISSVLEAGDLESVGRLMSREWSYRRQLAPEVSTPLLEDLLEAASAAGAWGGKVCGAGGGGCLAILAPADRRAAVGASLEQLGARLLDARPRAEPLEVRVGGD